IALKILNNYKKTDLILSANVICHIPYIHSIFKGVKQLLNDEGLFIFEDPYIGDVIKKTSFDQIYDEHVFLFSAHSVKYVANIHGLELVNLKKLSTHGGSMRYYIGKKNKHKISARVKKIM
ncbi:class I SAM-dependent methyltransferase, partial [Pelagibacteraceae bacterium]|nr:class I SAM-dependent methyltransferase [Pelagibacteraceae bacterium]